MNKAKELKQRAYNKQHLETFDGGYYGFSTAQLKEYTAAVLKESKSFKYEFGNQYNKDEQFTNELFKEETNVSELPTT
jgi:hypothetical protein